MPKQGKTPAKPASRDRKPAATSGRGSVRSPAHSTTRTPARTRSNPAAKPASRPATRTTTRTSTRSTRAAAPYPVQQGNWWTRLSPERRMDVIGVILALVGFLSILALLSKQNSVLTGWWVTALKQMAGWGAFLLPAGLFLLGLWLLLRNVESFPSPSGVRIAGLVLLFLNVVTILHLANGGGWELAEAGKGGGFLGGAFEQLLVTSLGTAGAVVVVTGWLLVALALTLDISLPIFSPFSNAWRRACATVGKPSKN